MQASIFKQLISSLKWYHEPTLTDIRYSFDLHFRDEEIETYKGYNELKIIQFTLEKLTLNSVFA